VPPAVQCQACAESKTTQAPRDRARDYTGCPRFA
jgi:hypothetical protein